MGVCFITGNGYREFLEPYLERGRKDGDIVDMEGNFMARHKGIASFTIGQRRGLGFAKGKPMYVVGIDAERNEVRVGGEEDLYSHALSADNLSWVNEPPSEEIEVYSKIRYRHSAVPSKITVSEDGKVIVNFDKPQKAVTPGQAIVFYRNEAVIGGGWIKEPLKQ